ncbi:MAG: hypothetical protein ISS33_05945 [Candidatus Omnitrophica bacterium]|nr:hypothetical protein [Candidatus Omnitrophota bacterium]
MPQKGSLKARLRKAGIRNYDVLIHDQPKEWLTKNFKQGATVYPVNVAGLIRNIVWQAKERIAVGEKPPLKELLRTFWYMYIKPTLSRAGALSRGTDQYAQMIATIVQMVKDIQVMRYEDIGFRDEGKAHRRVGANANIILFSEKLGHQDFLSEIADKYNISIVALGGQPSVLTSEYFVDAVRDRGVNLQRSFYLFSIVDYDPSGWIIRNAFINNLKFYGIAHTRVIDLIHPDMLKPEEVKLARCFIREPEGMRVKNKDWLKEVHKRDYRNQKYLEGTERGKPVLYGLEAESISAKRLEDKLNDVMVPLLGKSEDLLKTYELRGVDSAIKALMIHKLT